MKFSSNYTSTQEAVIQGFEYTTIHPQGSPTAALKEAIEKAVVQARRKLQDAATDSNKSACNHLL